MDIETHAYNPAGGRLRWENCNDLKAGLSYIVSFRPVWDTHQDCVLNKTQTKKQTNIAF